MKNEQLGFDYEDAIRDANLLPTEAQRTRERRLGDNRHSLLSVLPTNDDLMFNHSGLCQTSLPHVRPESNTTVWRRKSGRFTLMIRPGVFAHKSDAQASATGEALEDYVGVPYGAKARLIMFHLQTEGVKSPTVHLGKNLSAYLRSLNLPISGGPRGSIKIVQEQTLRIVRCTFTMQWDDEENPNRQIVTDTNIVEGMELWNAASEDWNATVQLSPRFHEHLVEHAVPLDKRGIAMLSTNSLGLDLYALFAYRLPRLTKPLSLSWEQLRSQMGASGSTKDLARSVREVLPTVMKAYPDAKVEVELGTGRSPAKLILKPSQPAVPKASVQGFRMIENK